ncbi:hypothetical protein M758_11G051600 [Ceratodon purpureus]|nr:hypothetical protein M758_11G051600 [Ceratodon purpureus]
MELCCIIKRQSNSRCRGVPCSHIRRSSYEFLKNELGNYHTTKVVPCCCTLNSELTNVSCALHDYRCCYRIQQYLMDPAKQSRHRSVQSDPVTTKRCKTAVLGLIICK